MSHDQCLAKQQSSTTNSLRDATSRETLVPGMSGHGATRMFQTVAQLSSFLTVGMSLMIVGPTLLDLRQQVHASLSAVSFCSTSRSAGYVFGSGIMGLIFPKINFQLASAMVLLCSAVSTAVLPHMRSLWSLLLVFFLNGAFVSLYETGGYVFILQLWGPSQSPGIMQSLMFMFGVGGLLAPVIVEPFLVTSETSQNVTTRISFDSIQTKLVYPYSILSILLAVNALFHLVNWIMDPETLEEKSKRNETDMRNSDCESIKNRESHKVGKYLTVILVLLFMHNYYGLEIAFGSYVLTFAVNSSLRTSKASGAYLTTAFWSSLTLPKILSIVMVKWMGNEMTIIYSLFVTLIGNVVLIPFADESIICLWVGTIIVGIGMSSIWACMFSYVEEKISLSSSIGSLMIVSAMVGEFIFPVIISTWIESEPRILLWTVLFSSLGITILFFSIIFINRKRMPLS